MPEVNEREVRQMLDEALAPLRRENAELRRKLGYVSAEEYFPTMSKAAEVFLPQQARLAEVSGKKRKKAIKEARRRARESGYSGTFASPEEARIAAGTVFAMGRRGLGLA